MNLLLKLIIFYIFLFLSIVSGIGSKDKNNIIKNKLYLFAGVFIFQFVLNIIDDYTKTGKAHTQINKIIDDSLQIATTSVIGYSIYIDLLLMDSTKKWIAPYIGSKAKNSFSISFIIISFVSILMTFKSLMNTS